MHRRSSMPGWMAWGIRIGVIAGAALAANALITYSMELAEQLPQAGQDAMRVGLIVTALTVYALLIATPFVPGIEIGFALLLLRGATIAPAVYLATILGLLLAFALGRLVPEPTLERIFRDVRLTRAANLMAHMRTLSLAERQAALEARLPNWLSVPFVQYRYVSLGVLLNIPGNVILGGGGGLMLAAGLSRLFRPRATVLTIAVAVLPIPLSIWWFGTGFLA